MESAYQLGYRSCYRQGSLEDNPFPEDSDDYDKWLWGFENASNEIMLSHYNGSLR